MAGIYRRLRPPRRPLLDTETGAFWSGLLPVPTRVAAFQALMTAVADELGMRDGVVLADTGGVESAPTRIVSVIQRRSVEQAVEVLLERATRLGYRLSDQPLPSGPLSPQLLRFERSPVLPRIYIWVYSPGEVVAQPMVSPSKSAFSFVVPAGGCGIKVEMSVGFTEVDPKRGSMNEPVSATRDHLAQLGIDITPPPLEELRWRWWWRRMAIRTALADTARKAGAYQGQVTGVWFVGPESVGPYTHGIATVQRGDAEEIGQSLLHRARNLIDIGPGAAASGAKEKWQGSPTLSVLTYAPGEQMSMVSATFQYHNPKSVVTIPGGSTGLLVGLTMRRNPLIL